MNDYYYILAWSGGKDSTFLALELLKRKEKLDEIIFCDTGFEFDEMYTYIEKIESYIKLNYPLVKITKLNYKSSKIWSEWSETNFKRGEHKGTKRGFPYVMGMSWCTRELKVNPINNYIKKNLKDKNIKKYIGIAFDEPKRIKENGDIYPLVEWEITEQQVLQSLKEMGFHNNLYNNFDRTGCYLCPKQGLKSLKTLYLKYPDLWANIEDMELKYKKQGSLFWKFKGVGTSELKVKFNFKIKDNLEETISCLCK